MVAYINFSYLRDSSAKTKDITIMDIRVIYSTYYGKFL